MLLQAIFFKMATFCFNGCSAQFWHYTIQSGLNLSLTFLRTYWRRWLPKSSNFDSFVHKTDFHWSIVQSTCSWANFSLFCLFTGRRSGFLTEMRPIIPFSLSRPLTVVSDIGESKSSLISARISDADFWRLPLLIAYILLSILWFVFLGRPDRFLWVFCPVCGYLLMAYDLNTKIFSIFWLFLDSFCLFIAK